MTRSETVILCAHDDLFDQHANDPFARSYGRPFRMPGAFDVSAEPEQRLSLAWRYAIQRRNVERCELVLKASLFFQAFVSSAARGFARDQTVVGIDGVILPSSVHSLETRLLERQLGLSMLLAVFASSYLKRRPRPLRRREG